MPVLSGLAIRAYYRVTVAGARLPATGPLLLVANHPNSLVDPALVVVAADRTVRFMTKAPLFDDKLIGWLVAAVGSVPVYRQQDDRSKLAQNLDSFRDVHAALAQGDAVGIFPEGITHSASRLVPLKTGAARIAIGAAAILGRDFPIVAMGLVFRDRDAFRSEAHVIVSEPLVWADLIGEGAARASVRELTARIEAQMHTVTLNLERWEDEPLVRAAELVWRAEFGPGGDAAAELERLRVTTRALAALREGTSTDWQETATRLRDHERELSALGITPMQLVAEARVSDAVRWSLARIPLLLVLPISLLGGVVYWLPKWVTTTAAAKMTEAEGPESLVTHRVLIGSVVFLLWFSLLAALVWARFGPLWGLLALLAQPFWAFAAMLIGDRRAAAWRAAARYVRRRSARERVASLRVKQRELATDLKRLYDRLVTPAR